MKGIEKKKLISKISKLIDSSEDITNWEGNYNPVIYLNLLGELKRWVDHQIICTTKDLGGKSK